MNFEWDQNKNLANQSKHKISFEEAIFVFSDPNAWITVDEKHSVHETRERIIGVIPSNQILVVAFTRRQDIIRIINARAANRRERKIYEDLKNRISL